MTTLRFDWLTYRYYMFETRNDGYRFKAGAQAAERQRT